MPFLGMQGWEAHRGTVHTSTPELQEKDLQFTGKRASHRNPRILRMTLRKDRVRCQNKDSDLNPVNNKMIVL